MLIETFQPKPIIERLVIGIVRWFTGSACLFTVDCCFSPWRRWKGSIVIRTLPGVLAGAFLPYLVDFDQDFALYVANAVKFALVMGVLYVPIAVIEKRRAPAP
jgi:hypothetical protein